MRRPAEKATETLSCIANYNHYSEFIEHALIDTEFYELRISVGNEYRIILFTIDHENLIEATQILLLNGFMKKSTKDYKKEIEKARTILKELTL